MVDLSLIASGSGVGDLTDFSFTVDSALQHTFVIISSHEGQADALSTITVDSAALNILTSGGDGTTTFTVYDVSNLSAGSHDLAITTNSGVFRYGYVLIKVLGWDGVHTESATTGVGTSLSDTLETRTPDNVLSVFTAETTVIATSADSELQNQKAGTGLLRVRFGTSYDTSGAISWTLATSQAWAMTLIRLRGTDFHVATPTHLATPTHTGTPDHVGTPGHVVINFP